MRQCSSLTVVATLVLLVCGGISTPATAQDIVINEPVIRGEVARLLRQAYDYEHRNSNRNVFRRSRHFHPTQNVFRSSRHYQQKLAASSDGYPLRTFVRFGRSVNGGPRELIEYSYATHRRSPFGLPAIEEPGYEALALRDAHYASSYDPRPYECAKPRHDHDRRDHFEDLHQPIEYRLITPESAAAELERDRRGPEDTGRTDVILRQVEQDDGSMRTIITNAPQTTGETIDDAWAMLNAGDADAAADLFRQHVMDEQRGAEAMAGYGLARLLAGELESAATALRRAQRIDEDVLQRMLIESDLREQLTAKREGLDESSAEEESDVQFVHDALESLLE